MLLEHSLINSLKQVEQNYWQITGLYKDNRLRWQEKRFCAVEKSGWVRGDPSLADRVCQQSFPLLTSQLCQRVKAPLLLPSKEAITVQEVGPGHVYCIEGGEAIFFEVFTDVPAGLYGSVLFTLRGQHWAAQEPQVGVAFPLEQVVQHADEQVLRAVLNHFSRLLIQKIRVHHSSIGNISARTQGNIHAFCYEKDTNIGKITFFTDILNRSETTKIPCPINLFL